MLDGQNQLKDPGAVDWYRTVMFLPDVREVTSVTVEKVVDDWRCNAATSTHPDDSSRPCTPECDLEKLLDIDYQAETAMLKDVSWSGPDGTTTTAKWYILKECVKAGTVRSFMEKNFRHPVINLFAGRDLKNLFFTDSLAPENGLRARMAFFFRNLYATPEGATTDWLQRYRQYETIWTHALGNYRTLALKMFNGTSSLSESLITCTLRRRCALLHHTHTLTV
jgi:hypothetical protein